MWLITNIGFFSVVQKPGEQRLTVRARVRSDLEQLREQFLPELSDPVADAGTDYRFRARVDHAAFARGLARMGEAIDYSNFKDEVARRAGWRRASLYGRVWRALFRLQEEEERR